MVDEDDVLGQRLADGDESALEECYARYGPTVLAYLRRHVGPDEAEDVLQHTFLDVWRHSERYDPRQSLGGWVFTIARRRAIDALRRRRPAVVQVDTLRDLVGEDGREVAERFAWAADVRAAMSRLPDAQRETLELAYFADHTQRDIARLLQVPIGTVKARMARGTRALGDLLVDYGHSSDVSAEPGRRTSPTDQGGASE
jgi:RNA polymerase sigma factor (sigma-70 family)